MQRQELEYYFGKYDSKLVSFDQYNRTAKFDCPNESAAKAAVRNLEGKEASDNSRLSVSLVHEGGGVRRYSSRAQTPPGRPQNGGSSATYSDGSSGGGTAGTSYGHYSTSHSSRSGGGGRDSNARTRSRSPPGSRGQGFGGGADYIPVGGYNNNNGGGGESHSSNRRDDYGGGNSRNNGGREYGNGGGNGRGDRDSRGGYDRRDDRRDNRNGNDFRNNDRNGGGFDRDNRQNHGGSNNRYYQGNNDYQQEQYQPEPAIADVDITDVVLPTPMVDAELEVLTVRSVANRTEFGTSGRQIEVLANSYRMNFGVPDRDFYHYDIKVTPVKPRKPKDGAAADGKEKPSVNRNVTRKIFVEWMKANGCAAVTDGERNLWTARKIDIPEEGAIVEVGLKEEDGQAGGDRNLFSITIRFAAAVSMKPLREFLETGDGEIPRTQMTILQLICAHGPSLDFTGFHKSTHWGFYYDSYNPTFIEGGLVMKQGWKQSVKTTLGELLLNVDVSHTAFYPTDTPHRAQIELHDNKGRCSVAQYFEKEYQIRLQYPDFPCVQCDDKGKILIPMELLTIKKGQRHLGKLSDAQTSEVIKMTAMRPNNRKRIIEEGRNILHQPDTPRGEFLRSWDIQIDDQLKCCDARVLDQPQVSGARNATLGFAKDGQLDYQNAIGFSFQRGVPIKVWGVATFDGELKNHQLGMVDNFFVNLSKECNKLGNPMRNQVVSDVMVIQRRGTSVEATLKQAIKTARAAAGDQNGAEKAIVFCIMMQKSSTYDEIKFLTETGQVDVVTQCLMGCKQFGTKRNNVGVNFALKINGKMGGANTFTPTMIMGCDVTHPPAGVHNGVSICAVVGSIDRNFVEYRAAERVQGPRVEMIDDLTGLTLELFKHFYGRNNVLPKRLIVYRDGVSDGQFQEVSLKEVNSLKKAFHQVGIDCLLTFVIVSKRHSHRFFPMNQRDALGNGNLLPGTVIDSGVTHPSEFDFFLCSHSGIQGTSRPAHYQVLLDANEFGADEFQSITYNLAYTYARANKPVSVVPAVYYANLAADRARYHRPGGVNGSESGMTYKSGDGDIAAAIGEFSNVSSFAKKAMYFL
ncbi:UNVERIFIED_CONTAM: Eukaryotic translation initiation factor 2C [Siphonaria sp. JEL0065]|nr:Eukaryotic translation initiation factor 2C [Siphonaria sp. JEL0065]